MSQLQSCNINTDEKGNFVALIKQLHQSTTPADKVAAIQALTSSGTKAAIPPLIEALNYHHPAVPTVAIEGLIKLAPNSVEPLIAAFRASGDHGVQAYIVQGLAQMGDFRALELLLEVVGVEVANHCQGNVRRVAARGLGKIGTTANDPQIAQLALEKLTWALLNADDWALRYAAVVSLQEIGTVEALSSLQQALTQELDPVVQIRISTALTSWSVN